MGFTMDMDKEIRHKRSSHYVEMLIRHLDDKHDHAIAFRMVVALAGFVSLHSSSKVEKKLAELIHAMGVKK